MIDDMEVSMSNNQSKLDFDDWLQLFKSDPIAFEEMRKQEIERFINNAPEYNQRRLRGLQFRVDAKRDMLKHTPYKACVELSKMMHESFAELRYQLNEMCAPERNAMYGQSSRKEQLSDNIQAAQLLSFPTTN